MQYNYSRNLAFFIGIVLLNIVVVFVLAHNRGTLNYDGIFYVTLADLIQKGDLAHPLLEHRGFVYSYLIASLSSITQLNLQSSAYLLNALFLSLISVAFLFIVQQLGGKTRLIQWLSVLLVILFPSMLKYKSMIIRDFAYISCYLWSLFFLLKYVETKKIIFLFMWCSALVVGAFFRIESVFIMLFSGLFLCALYLKGICSHVIKFKYLYVLPLIAALLALWLSVGIDNVGGYYLNYTFDYISKSLSRLYAKLSASDQSLVFLIFKAFGQVLYEVARRLDFVYLIIAVAGYKLISHKKIENQAMLCYVLCGLFVLVLFNLKEGFITSRYALATVLTILLACPFFLEKAISQFNIRGRLYQSAMSLLLLVLVALSLTRFDYSDRNLERAAGEWVVENISPDDSVISNNTKVLYYSQRFPYVKRGRHYYRYETSYMVDEYRDNYEQSDYLVLVVDPNSPIDLEQRDYFDKRFDRPVMQVFETEKKRKKYVNVYKIRS